MISFLHTGDVHVATFDRLMDELAPGTVRQHRVEQGWLDEARDKGMSDALWQAIQTGMAELASGGVGVCTCSSIGAAAEAAYSPACPVVRIDRTLMAAAIEHGPRPLVAMCLESTRAPTMDLLADVASNAGMSIEPKVVMCEAAWPHFEAGDMPAYASAIADAVRPVVAAGKPDCIVLAQASMAPAEPLLQPLNLPVLSSPRLGVLKALELLRGQA
jgi:hypothetical protein